MTPRRGTGVLEVSALALLAALYFHGPIFNTLERTDEGQIVYPSWQVAEGQIPYVGFQHLYGPSLFFLNGTLFRLWGPDLRVVRLSLVALKTAVVVLVYLLARRTGSRLAAALVSGLLIAVWGMPSWLFNVPYATYYATALCLAGVLIASGAGGAWRWLLGGLCFGVAATFKQTQGLFAFCSLVLFVIFATQSGAGSAPATSVRGAAAGARLLALLGALALAIAYMADHLASATAVAVLLPFAAGAATLAVREWRHWPPGEEAVRGVPILCLATAGAALPVLAYAVFYARIGALDALAFNTVVGLPQRIAWFVPFPKPEWRTIALSGLIASSFAVVREATRPVGRWRLAGALLAFAASAGVLLLEGRRAPGLHAYLAGGEWTSEFFLLLFWLPFLILGAAALALRGGEPLADAALRGRNLRAFLFFFGTANLMQYYPAADLPHAAMILPVFLPLVADGLARLRRAVPGSGVVVGGIWLLAATWAFVQPHRVQPPPGPPAFVRASGIGPGDAKTAAVARLVRYLSGTGVRDGGLLVLTGEQMLYFLAGVRSALPREEFVLYLVAVGLIADEDARALVAEDAVLARLADARPLVVDQESAATARFRRVFPRVAELLAARYGVSEVIDGYRVLAPQPDRPGSPPDRAPP